MAGPSELKKQIIYKWLRIDTFQPSLDNIYFFHQHSQPLYDFKQKQIENFVFVPSLNLDLIDLLNNNGTKYLLIYVKLCEVICDSKPYVHIATTGRPRWLKNFYIKLNLFHRGNLVRDLELQNTNYYYFFKSPFDVMQIRTLSAQLELELEPVDWY